MAKINQLNPNKMTKFIDVSNDTKEVKKETVFTEYFCKGTGWLKSKSVPKEFEEVYLLEKIDGDLCLFYCLYHDGNFFIYKGIKGDEFN